MPALLHLSDGCGDPPSLDESGTADDRRARSGGGGPIARLRRASAGVPEVLGYVRVWLGDPPELAAQRCQLLGAFAAAMGWQLAEVFVEDEPNRPLLAFGALVAAARAVRPVAVLVSHPTDLGSTAAGATALRRRVEVELGVPVLVVQGLPRHAREWRGW